ncbi:unnamed protein product [Parnassius apollo]|uniref:(apollo) hypothetical protein n=1 Tax=Parnassius apollo TaxID=110799 RepID=A0A8S3WAE6_PARAO|nr:unnamed protein product [Parnassius apollo]
MGTDHIYVNYGFESSEELKRETNLNSHCTANEHNNIFQIINITNKDTIKRKAIDAHKTDSVTLPTLDIDVNAANSETVEDLFFNSGNDIENDENVCANIDHSKESRDQNISESKLFDFDYKFKGPIYNSFRDVPVKKSWTRRSLREEDFKECL